MSFREMSPSGCHHWDALFTHLEVMGFLIILHITSLEYGSSAIGVVPEFAHSCSFEIGWVESKLVVSAYLIESILITHVFISCEV